MARPTQSESTTAIKQALAAARQSNEVELTAWLRHHLLEHVMPFWERHSTDEFGGIVNCLSDTGEVMLTEKWLWSQWRAVWVFSRLYNTIDRNPKWLERARGIAEFCLQNGWLEQEQGWALLLAQDGKILRRHESIYTDGFAVYGLAELFRATKSPHYREWAIRTADAAMAKIKSPYDQLPHFPYPIPSGAKVHGVPMIWSQVLADAGEQLGEPRYLGAARKFSEEIFRDFYQAEIDRVVEFVPESGGVYPGLQGAATVPGHVIEDMWFQWHIFRQTGWKDAPRDLALRLILRHLELGWDSKHGGILLAIDREGRDEVGWKFADTKLWWPQTEALYATLLGWCETGDSAYFDWYEKLWQLCLNHYVDWDNGEWRQKLNNDLTPMRGVVALPVKDPFHLPRALILQIELLEARQRQQ
jgi:N-acylglucosamine 2-epimerase|uniref:AGE family epimerase/isomerase n=1 Tax=Cephaloticoccus sp. TaxID=1985742 RepID=UPI004049A348